MGAVLVLGAYGLIGQAVVERLVTDGHEVVGLGRDVTRGQRKRPDIVWREADIGRLLTADSWAPLLAGVEVVVNAAGALQQGPRDDLQAIHATALEALAAAAGPARLKRIVQISAVGAATSASTQFLRTKAIGDRALVESGQDVVILRPGLVISPMAYGGTALLRALAAFPLITPLVEAGSQVRTVAVDQVAEVVALAVAGRLPPGTVIDLVEPEGRDLAATVTLFRGWLGLPRARLWRAPAWLGGVVGAVADGLAVLGWRSPLRSTALKVMSEGVGGDPAPALQALGRPLDGLPQTLARYPAGVQELWFARLWLLKPVLIGVLALFWTVSGLVGALRWPEAVEILTSRGVEAGLAKALVLGGAATDVVLGLLVLSRRAASPALLGMMAVTLAYLAGSALLAPDLWLDPLGPMVKAVPILALALVALALLEDR